MPGRRALPALLGAAMLLLGLPNAATPAAGSSCSGWSSHATPPGSIRVYRAATGAVETVDFRTYVANVLSREWISSWTTESIRAGALAVKNYAWYQVLHWRGHVNGAGACFDVFDSTRDQHYDPSRPTYAPMVAAVDATWGARTLKNGAIFPTYYNAGAAGEACGANANGWQMFQWGSEACGRAGLSAAQIITTYYAGAEVSSAPPPAPPVATPTPTASPPTAPSPGAAPASGTPPATPALDPGSSLAPAPAAPSPALLVFPPAEAVAQPGGGQQVAAPPTPPPVAPVPVVVAPGVPEDPAVVALPAEPQLVEEGAAWPRTDPAPWRWHEPLRWADPAAPGATQSASPVDARLLIAGALWRQQVDRLASVTSFEPPELATIARAVAGWLTPTEHVARR